MSRQLSYRKQANERRKETKRIKKTARALTKRSSAAIATVHLPAA